MSHEDQAASAGFDAALVNDSLQKLVAPKLLVARARGAPPELTECMCVVLFEVKTSPGAVSIPFRQIFQLWTCRLAKLLPHSFRQCLHKFQAQLAGVIERSS